MPIQVLRILKAALSCYLHQLPCETGEQMAYCNEVQLLLSRACNELANAEHDAVQFARRNKPNWYR